MSIQTDRYGRPLPEPKWVDKPTQVGLYLYTSCPQDWDIARPVGVHSSEDQFGTVTWLANFYCSNEYNINIEHLPTEGRWFGPFRIAKPEWEK